MNSARVLAALASFGSMSCAGSAAVRTRARPTARYVLIEPTALRFRPDATAPALDVGGARPMAFRRVALRDGWVELETVARPSQQCDPTLAPPDGVRLRLFAPASAITPTLAQTLASSGAEGSFSARPGVAVNALGQIVSGALVLTPHEPPATATTFRARAMDASTSGAARLREGTRITLPDGATAEVTLGAVALVTAQRRDGSGTRVSVRTACVRVESVVTNESVLPVMDLELEARDAPAAPSVQLTRGTPLRWPDGSPAGRVVTDVSLQGEARTVGALRCVRVPLQVSGREPVIVEVCADGT